MKQKGLPLTRRGLILAGGSFSFLLLGVIIDDNTLFLLGFCGIILLILAYGFAKFTLSSLEISLDTPTRVQAGRSFTLTTTLHNPRSWFDAFQVEISIPFFDSSTFSAQAPWTAAGESSSLKSSLLLPSRGIIDTLEATLLTHFPLGFFQLSRTILIRHSLTVTPRPIRPLEMNRNGSLHDTLPQGGTTLGVSLGDPRGIRPWQAGDSARQIHWPASARAMARGHDIRVREYDPPGYHPDQCCIVFHSYASGREMLRHDRFERAISLLVGVLTTLQTQGIPSSFIADFNQFEEMVCSTRAQLVDLLDQLASIKRCHSSEAHDLQNILQSTPKSHGLIIISDMTPDSWSHLFINHPHCLIIDIRQIRHHRTLFTAH